MIVRCPNCGAENSLDSIIDDDMAAKSLAMALELSPVGKLLIKYIGLFRPSKRRLSWARVHSLLAELIPHIKAGRIERDRQVYDIPLAVWELGFEKVLAARDSGSLHLPLKSHGYLYEILIAEAARGGAVVTRMERDGQPAQPLSKTMQGVMSLQQRKQRGG